MRSLSHYVSGLHAYEAQKNQFECLIVLRQTDFRESVLSDSSLTLIGSQNDSAVHYHVALHITPHSHGHRCQRLTEGVSEAWC